MSTFRPEGVASTDEAPLPEAPRELEPRAGAGGGVPRPADAIYVVESGHWLHGPFRTFYEQYGPGLCGQPLTEVVVEAGVPTQYFQRLALEEPEPGHIRVKALGEAWLGARPPAAESVPRRAHSLIDLTHSLATHPVKRYAQRPLADIRYLVVHHTGAGPGITPETIALEHVEVNGWPGIGYHDVIATDGLAYRTQDQTTVSFHARQFNPVALGLALIGDYSSDVPPEAQLDAAAGVLAGHLDELGLAVTAIRGHRELVAAACPGEAFLSLWKPRLVRTVEQHLARLASARDGGSPAS